MLSRIFRGENENASVKRKRQIDTLKIFNDNVVELREDVEYQVQFDAGDKRMAIMVSLSPEFPLEKPVLRVSPPINHPWCNEHNEIVNAPGLLNFTVHSDLGRVVQAIIREFSKNPPKLIEDSPPPVSSVCHRDLNDRVSPSYALQQQYPEIPSTSYNSYYNTHYPQYSSSSTNTNNTGYNYNYKNSGNTYAIESQAKSFASTSHLSTYSPSSTSNSLHSTKAPCYSSNQYANTPYLNSHYGGTNYGQTAQTNVRSKTPQCSEFPELNDLSTEELQKLGDNVDRLDEFLEKHSQIKDLNTTVEDAIDWVENTARGNLLKESELEELRNQVAEKAERVTILKARYDQLNQKYNKLSEVFTPDHIKNCLKHAADESHEKSEAIAEDFLNRKIDVERFLSTYVECRKLGQARRTKEEKLAHQLNELKRAGY
ncbi:vacuolar protein sorting-associated protein 37A [Neodiprion virginianus]|uniref:vacuolar protein sorting-associated protein 37A n=1 Tax=Neodiprion virginianus TaxID=2961670 RepID=UPI001EE76F0C|nr:vacuolar protein sorting-associated protein 37A [Neodiprion virginianus]